MNGSADETIRLVKNDVIEIEVDTIEELNDTIEKFNIGSLFDNNIWRIIWKPSGINSSAHSNFENAVYNSTFGLHFVFRLQKSLQGLCLIAKTVQSLQDARLMLCNRLISLVFHCVVVGYVGEIDYECDLVHSTSMRPSLHIKVLSYCRCRTVEYITLLEVSPYFYCQEMGLDAVSSEGIFNRANSDEANTHYPSQWLVV